MVYIENNRTRQVVNTTRTLIDESGISDKNE
jgi:hypothetical protein